MTLTTKIHENNNDLDSEFTSNRLLISLIESIYQIECAQCVSGITFFRYTQNRKVGKPNNFKSLRVSKPKVLNGSPKSATVTYNA